MIDFTHNPIIPADYKSRGRGLPYEASPLGAFSVLALPIFPGRLQPSIVGRSELNFRVRDGNGWTLALISTNYEVYCTFKTEQCIIGNQEGLLPA